MERLSNRWASAAITWGVTVSVGAQGSSSSRFYDTEMLALNISGGGLPSGVMVRESPSKASLGRTSVRTVGPNDYRVDSFFDIFTEISLDGGGAGGTWSPAQGAAQVELATDPRAIHAARPRCGQRRHQTRLWENSCLTGPKIAGSARGMKMALR